jgi:hypothetical protein
LADHAAELAAIGLPVLPLLPRTKRPRFDGGYKIATCDQKIIAAHWRRYREDNVGVRPPRGVGVLDVDLRNGGEESLRALTRRHGAIPKTWVTRTGSGGWHYWLTVGDMPVRSRLGAGIDVKHGGNGFVVAPPSVHPCGGVYVWQIPPLGRPALAPWWLRCALAAPVYSAPLIDGGRGHGPFCLAALVGRIHAAPEGRRNTTLYGAARDAAKQGDLDAFAEALVCAAVARGLPPVEAEATIRSARKAG